MKYQHTFQIQIEKSVYFSDWKSFKSLCVYWWVCKKEMQRKHASFHLTVYSWNYSASDILPNIFCFGSMLAKLCYWKKYVSFSLTFHLRIGKIRINIIKNSMLYSHFYLHIFWNISIKWLFTFAKHFILKKFLQIIFNSCCMMLYSRLGILS